MGWTPAVVIVVRHGARLDSAKEQWHLTSPTPYDPPLTYGGWTQSTALGARIADILRTRETDDEVPLQSEDARGSARRRRHKVIIHTSPYLRCVQTAVAISSGLAQNPGHLHAHHASSSTSHSRGLDMSKLHSSPKLRPSMSTSSSLASISEPLTIDTNVNGKQLEQSDNIKKSTIRVDACLGEWLTPEYFKEITPPPNSIMMMTGAKADLLRKEDHKNLIHTRDMSADGSQSANKPFPGGWGSSALTEKSSDSDGIPTMASLTLQHLKRDRTSSMGSSGSASSRHGMTRGYVSSGTAHGVYKPPVPSYSVSSSDPIPPGYLSHARDACVDVDYHWDSMRAPQEWGDGGELGEEWHSMHKRFRKALADMIAWYGEDPDPGKLVIRNNESSTVDAEPSHDDDTDLVLVLVSHQAGCNALLGALLDQPVLLDVPVASITMAVRNPSLPGTPDSSLGSDRIKEPFMSSRMPLHEQYTVKLEANTAHLRPSVFSSSSSRQSSAANMAAFRENRTPSPGPAGFGSIRRTASVAKTPASYAPHRQTSFGLWSATPPADGEKAEEDKFALAIEKALGHSGDSTQEDRCGQKDGSAQLYEQDNVPHTGVVTPPVSTPTGLWGAGSSPLVADKVKEVPRRWTVTARGVL